jgi:ABC-type multidrug transport system fused ATPase/permease subunit
MAPSEPYPVSRSLGGAYALARDVLRSTRRAFALLWATAPVYTVALGLLSVATGLLPAALAAIARRIIDGIVRAAESGLPVDRAAVYALIAIELGLVALLVASRRVTGVIESLVRVLFAEHINEQIIEKALRLSLEDFEDPATLDRLNRARRGASYRPLDLVQGALGLAQDTVTLAAFGGLLANISGWMMLLIAAAAVPEFVATTRFSRESFRLFHWRTPETRKQNYYEMVLTQPETVKEVRLFELGPLLFGRYKDFFTRFWHEDRALTLRRGLWSLALGLVSTASYYGAYAWVAFRAMHGRITLGDVSLFVAAFKDAQSTIGSSLHALSRAYEDHLYLTSLFEFLDHVPAVADDGTATSGPTPTDGIRFESVSFAYPGSARPTLTDVTLHIPAGRKLALVGENGAGKTTLIKLLTRLYAPTGGRITLDGRDLREWDSAALRRRIGVIFQDFVRYQFTVGENIGVGDVRAFDDEARWRDAAERGMAAEFIDELPKKYHTQLGKWFDDGRDLSIGQWQKVALARAFMRRDADILVLDEPTASMDAAAEARVFERFRSLTEQRTAVVISHRFSTVRMADSIAVIADGRVIEQGTHDELVARGGRYAELFFLQAKGYR